MPEVLALADAADPALVAVVHVFAGRVIEQVARAAKVVREFSSARRVGALVGDALLGVAHHAEYSADGEPVDLVIRADLVVAMPAAYPHAAAGRLYLAVPRVMRASEKWLAGRFIPVAGVGRPVFVGVTSQYGGFLT